MIRNEFFGLVSLFLVTGSLGAHATHAPKLEEAHLAATSSLVQQRNVTGVVTDEEGNPLDGVTVTLRGGNQVVTTDENGAYRITAPSDQAILVFTNVGFEPVERTVGNQTILNVTMQ